MQMTCICESREICDTLYGEIRSEEMVGRQCEVRPGPEAPEGDARGTHEDARELSGTQPAQSPSIPETQTLGRLRVQ